MFFKSDNYFIIRAITILLLQQKQKQEVFSQRKQNSELVKF